MAFAPGRSGNPKGRPTKEEMALRNLDKGEFDKLLKKLRPASLQAVDLFIAGMQNLNLSDKDRQTCAGKILDVYTKMVGMDNQIKRAQNTQQGANVEDDDAPQEQVYEFRIVPGK